MSVQIQSFLRLTEGSFAPIESVKAYHGDSRYVEGAVVMTVDGRSLLSVEMWTDINWLWPYLIQASDECRRMGHGERYFPDQALLFSVKACDRSLGQRLLLSVQGEDTNRSAIVERDEYYRAMASEGLFFFRHLSRLLPDRTPDDEIELIMSWGYPA